MQSKVGVEPLQAIREIIDHNHRASCMCTQVGGVRTDVGSARELEIEVQARVAEPQETGNA